MTLGNACNEVCAARQRKRSGVTIDAGNHVAREPDCFHGFVDRSFFVTALRHANMFSSSKTPSCYDILRYWVPVPNNPNKSITE